MTKLSKKISKIKKNIRLGLYLGKDRGDFDEYSEILSTIFWYKFDNKSRFNKNLIYVEDLKFLNSINDVEMIFLDEAERATLLELQPLLNRSQPIILLRSFDQISIEYSTFFNKIRYRAADSIKGYQVWKINI
jgi:hypothetical protein